MLPLVSAMTNLRKSLLAALKSFLRGKSFLQALFAFWISPSKIKDQHGNGQAIAGSKAIADFLKEAEERLLGPVQGDRLRTFSADLKAQFRERLHTHPECMLPSFNHLLPTGKEMGQFLALDVGGSTLRVGLVELRGREAKGRECKIVRLISFKITPAIKKLQGMAFFDWMGERIREVLHKDGTTHTQRPIPIGLAWSFPVEQVSLGGGLLMGMGKGFLATEGLLGQDLGEIIKVACKKQGLDVQLASIINDSTATLLSQAYAHAETRFGLILGTGTNIAVHLPVSALGRVKYGSRAESWFEAASHVIVNTELGMFGHGILPMTRWDEQLNATHPRPEFQPLEHFLSGYYLGEICRLIIVEAVETKGLLGGHLPPSLVEPYSLDTEVISRMEADTSTSLEKALLAFTTAHPCPVPATAEDISAIRTLASFISRRSAALLGAAVFALWELRYETAAEQARDSAGEEKGSALEDVTTPPHTKVAFNGSVLEHYPGYLAKCQNHIATLVAGAENPILAAGSIHLVPAVESSIIGAAVALGCALGEEHGV
ncbi:hexokinase-1 [Xylariaceae sp. FL0594]|nr:hexokinase-1 [Xylariaceae sp. FL0594]